MKNLYRIAFVTLAFLACVVAFQRTASAHVSVSTMTLLHSEPVAETREMLPASTKTPTIPPDDGYFCDTMIGLGPPLLPDRVVTVEPLAGGGVLITERTTYYFPTYDLVVTRYYVHVPVPRPEWDRPSWWPDYPGGPPRLPAKPLAPV